MTPPTKNAVERIELAPGFSVSRVMTGLWQMADMERDGRTADPHRAARAMIPYVTAGFTTFDMADHYGSAEIVAGQYGAEHGDEAPAELLTKWVPSPGAITKRDVETAVDRARTRLQTETIDLLQFHAWRYPDPSWLDCLFWLDELRQQGAIRHLGLTNVDAAHLRIVLTSGVPVVSNQVCFSLLDQRAAGGLAKLCAQYRVKLLAYGTVAGGFLTERWLGKPEPDWSKLATWSEMKYGRFIRAAGGWDAFQGVLGVLARIASRRAVSMANVASRAILEHPAVAAVIIGARLGVRSHLEDNRRLFEFALDPEDHDELGAALATLTAIPGDSGDEYRKAPFLTASGDLSHHVDAFPPPYPVHQMAGGRTTALSGTMWEPLAGFCRATRTGDRILISGTTATHRDRTIGGDDPAAQAHFIIDKIEGAVQALGGQLSDIVRTRIYVKRLDDWEPVARAHGERFHAILPANTLVRADLVGNDYLVEIEAEAVVTKAP